MEEFNTVFLGGTCANSTWRDKLIPMLEVSYFNPVVEDWKPEDQLEEIRQRANCAYVLYVISPEMEGVYSIAEVVDDSNKRPEQTIFCVLESADQASSKQDGIHGKPTLHFSKAQLKSLKAVETMVENNGSNICYSLREVAKLLNRGATNAS